MSGPTIWSQKREVVIQYERKHKDSHTPDAIQQCRAIFWFSKVDMHIWSLENFITFNC